MIECVDAVHGGVPADVISLQQQCLLHGRLKLFFRSGRSQPWPRSLALFVSAGSNRSSE